MRVGLADSHSRFQAAANHASVDMSPGVDLSSLAVCMVGGTRVCSEAALLWCCGGYASRVSGLSLARARVAACRERPAGAIPASTGRWNMGVGFRQPMVVLRALFMATSTFLACGLLHQYTNMHPIFYTNIQKYYSYI